MRTTLDLEDGLFKKLKVMSSSQGKTLRSLIQDLLQEALAARIGRGAVSALPVSRSLRFPPDLDLDDTSSVLGYLESQDGPA